MKSQLNTTQYAKENTGLKPNRTKATRKKKKRTIVRETNLNERRKNT